MLTADELMNRQVDDDEDPVSVQQAPQFVCPEYEQALELEDTKTDAAVTIFREIVDNQANYTDENMIKVVEDSIYRLAKIFAKHGRVEDLKGLFTSVRPFFSIIPKAKTAKIVRVLIDEVASTQGVTTALQVEIIGDAINWCNEEKRNFLRQRMESKMANLLLDQKKYKPSLKMLNRLIKEVKKFDDKLLMVEINLTESKVHMQLQNLAKAKGALTSARSSANSVYCPPLLQAQIDIMAGTLCAEEGDFKTAFSYFYEAFEGYNTVNNPGQAIKCLKYMLLGKIMTNSPEDVYSIIKGKAGVKYAGREIEAMRAVADAHKARSIDAFDAAYEEFKEELSDDIVGRHLTELKNNLVEQNLLRLIEPFSRVELSHIAELINMPLALIEAKLSEMVLDRKLNGILDQGRGVLVLFEDTPADESYSAGLETVSELSSAVAKLYQRAQQVTQTI